MQQGKQLFLQCLGFSIFCALYLSTSIIILILHLSKLLYIELQILDFSTVKYTRFRLKNGENHEIDPLPNANTEDLMLHLRKLHLHLVLDLEF